MGKLKFSAWLAPWNDHSLASFEANAGRLTRVYPTWYGTGPAGAPYRHREGTAAMREKVRAAAAAAGVDVWPLIANYSASLGDFDPGRMRLLMAERATRRMHIEKLLGLCAEDGAQGVDLDYENLHDVDRDLYSDFIDELCAAFHQAGLKVGMAVHAKTSEPGGPGGSRAQDYARLGRACDSLQVMCYDYHWSTSGPGPVAPPAWSKQVMAHALKLVPADRLEFGVPGYGYDWEGERGTPLQWDAWVHLKGAAAEERDPETAELRLRHGSREAWMNDAISLTAKLEVARELGLVQAAMWVLGSEDPRLWALLDSLPDPFLAPSSAR